MAAVKEQSGYSSGWDIIRTVLINIMSRDSRLLGFLILHCGALRLAVHPVHRITEAAA